MLNDKIIEHQHSAPALFTVGSRQSRTDCKNSGQVADIYAQFIYVTDLLFLVILSLTVVIIVPLVVSRTLHNVSCAPLSGISTY